MAKEKLQTIYHSLCLTSVFRSVLEKPLFRAFFEYCSLDERMSFAQKSKAYAAFVAEIYQENGSLTELVKRQVFEDENVYVKAVAKKKIVPECVWQAVNTELKNFSDFAALTREDFALDLGVAADKLPAFQSFHADMAGLYEQRLQQIDKFGYGIFSAKGMFRLSDDKQIEAIASADTIDMEAFIGYQDERMKVVQNTRAFVQGKPAANALLCGDAGTGKSSTVKAVANSFFNEGVRVIELRKDQLSLLPLVMSKIVGNPLKFIIFIDDLSFNRSDDNFSMLKAALEGSASAKADNAVIYATSNRRHIIKESFGDREGDDVHRNDTLQETLSLSERFGLVVLFSKPNKALYLQIVKELADKKGVQMEEEQLFIKAEEFALRKGNRSARCAEQFIASVLQ